MKIIFKIQVILFFYFFLLEGKYGQQEEEQEQPATTSPSPPITSENTTTTPTESNTTNSNNNNNNTTDVSVIAGAYESNCTKDEECDESIGLGCNLSSNSCDCSRPKEMIFDTTKIACLVLESFSCEKIIQGKDAAEFECTKNAVCETTTTTTDDSKKQKAGGKYCRCNEGYSTSSSHTCLGGFKQTCHPETDPCNDVALLICDVPSGESEGKCGCYNPKESVFENGSCIYLAGADCTYSSPPYVLPCTGNATCNENGGTNNTTGTGKCECDSGFEKLSDGRCLHGSSIQLVGNGLVLTAIIFISSVHNKMNFSW